MRIQFPLYIGVLLILLLNSCTEESKEISNTWTSYKADAKASSYSPLDQINVSNVGQLKNVWTFHANDVPNGEEPAASSQANPIIIDGVMYANSRNQQSMPSMPQQVSKSGDTWRWKKAN
ncbi:hypothetical protein Q2T40_02220 [Winogradskyella maritima]|nr:hypothetical protein [Winogradskyella maritima]